MCGIIGAFDVDNAYELVINGLKKMPERGLDGYGYYDGTDIVTNANIDKLKKSDSKNIIAHQLHAIVKNIKQPLKENGVLVINSEIYNWKQLKNEHNIIAENDSILALKLIEKIGIEKAIDNFDGPFALCYQLNNKIFLARDIIGKKPLWIKKDKNSFLFASEKKALISQGYNLIEELSPRVILEYDIISKKTKLIKRDFFKITPINKLSKEIIIKNLSGLIVNAVAKRIPDQKVGVLFSGGIDSVVVAKILTDLGIDVTCYTAGLDEVGLKESEDLIWAKKASKLLGLKLKIKTLKLNEVEKYIKKIIPLIEDSNVIKTGVALPFFVSCELAKKDGIRVIFSGLGSEEIFAGYERHENSLNVNKECLHGLLQMHERDLYRDDVVTMANNMELRLPFLDKTLINYALKVDPKYKIDKKDKKIILREIAHEIFKIPHDLAYRPKKAAQYGSGFDKAITKLTKKNNMKFKADYLSQFLPNKNKRLGALFSGGKDSTYAIDLMKKHNYDVNCLITIKSENQDSYMFHTPNINVTSIQAESMNIPLIEQTTKGNKEEELIDLKQAILNAKNLYQIEGVITGAVFSNYQRERVEKICDELGLTVFSPLWHKNQDELMDELLKNNYKIIFSSIAALGLDKSWLGHEITDKDVIKLKKLNSDIGLHSAGEGGEFESLVLDCPLFNKKIEITESDINEENEYTAKMTVKNVKLVPK